MLGDDFGAPRASLTELLSKYSPSSFPFYFRLGLCCWIFVKDVLGSHFVERHIVLSHVDRDKCHDIADHLRYAGSGCNIDTPKI